MEILIGDKYVDFEAPIFMTDEQREKFVDGIKKIFGDVQIKNVEEQIVEMLKPSGTIIDWKNPKNLFPLTMGNLNEEEIADKLGIDRKHIFAIQLKRASFISEIYDWATKKGITQITEKDIEEFLKEVG